MNISIVLSMITIFILYALYKDYEYKGKKNTNMLFFMCFVIIVFMTLVIIGANLWENLEILNWIKHFVLAAIRLLKIRKSGQVRTLVGAKLNIK